MSYRLKRFREQASIVVYCIACTVQLALRQKMLVSPHGSADVCLGTHGIRVKTAHVSVLSFVRKNDLARNISIHVDKGTKFSRIERFVLARLEKLGARVLESEKRGPHTKYHNYLNNFWDGSVPIVLIDDDMIYDQSVFAQLVLAHSAEPEINHCARSYQVALSGQKIAPYREWGHTVSSRAAADVFATNVGGVILNTAFCRELVRRGDAYQKHCKHADDIWFHWTSVELNIPYRQLERSFSEPIELPFTQGNALWKDNVLESRNDKIIAAQYDQNQITKISNASLKN